MNILLLGSGGREHALAWKMAASPLTDRLFCPPGNAGIAQEAECVALDLADHAAIIAFCRANGIDFVVVGPEAPLCAGIVDDLEASGIKAFGPGRFAAQLEGSKGFTKDLCRSAGIPTAAYERFRSADEAKAYARARGAPIVVKADGLAAGKGVVVAEASPRRKPPSRRFSAASLARPAPNSSSRNSLLARSIVPCPMRRRNRPAACVSARSQARIRRRQGTEYRRHGRRSPAPIIDAAMSGRVMAEIVQPTLRAMKGMGAPYKGVLYVGLMITAEGPKLIEYNVRFGDPECQVLMPRLMSDLVPALLASRDGVLKALDLRWHSQVALTVVMAAKGYPGAYAKGSVIEGLAEAAAVDGVEIFHAGTKEDGGHVVANGGRVLNVSALGRTVSEAQARAYAAIARIRWPEGFFRHDIGWRAIAREK